MEKADAIAAVMEGAVLVGGFSAIPAALYGLGIAEDSVLQYQTAIEADPFLVMAHDTPSRIALAKGMFEAADATRADVRKGAAIATAQAVG